MRPEQAPAIIPTVVGWGINTLTDDDGRSFVVLSMFTPLGDQHFYFDALGAKELSASLDQKAALILATKVTVPTAVDPVQVWIDRHGKGQRCSDCFDTLRSCPLPM